MSENLCEVSSTPHFQELLSRDLNRVSVINFWAPWAEPCEKMNAVVGELAIKYPAVLFLQVAAEDHDDIAGSFEVEAVPTLVLLRGHALLGRISGADAAQLTQLLAKHGNPPSYTALSRTNQEPAKPPASSVSRDHNQDTVETPEELEKRLRGIMNQSRVVLFMKGSPDSPRCGFSKKIVGLLRDNKFDFTHFDILTDENVRQGLKKLNDWPTYPQLIVKGELIGGLDIVQEMIENGEFQDLVA